MQGSKYLLFQKRLLNITVSGFIAVFADCGDTCTTCESKVGDTGATCPSCNYHYRTRGEVFLQSAACIYSKSYMTWCDTTLENVTSNYLHRTDCQSQTPGLIQEHVARSDTLPHLPCWQWETVVNLERLGELQQEKQSHSWKQYRAEEDLSVGQL